MFSLGAWVSIHSPSKFALTRRSFYLRASARLWGLFLYLGEVVLGVILVLSHTTVTPQQNGGITSRMGLAYFRVTPCLSCRTTLARQCVVVVWCGGEGDPDDIYVGGCG